MTIKEIINLLKHLTRFVHDETVIKLQMAIEFLEQLEQEPRCKKCKWWKDSDGKFRRGIGAESQCPINREEVYEGNGYCFLYEPKKCEDKE